MATSIITPCGETYHGHIQVAHTSMSALLLVWNWAVGKNGLGSFHPVGPLGPPRSPFLPPPLFWLPITLPAILSWNHSRPLSPIFVFQVSLQVFDLHFEMSTFSGFMSEVSNLLCYLGYLFPENSLLKTMPSRGPQYCPLFSLCLKLEMEKEERGRRRGENYFWEWGLCLRVKVESLWKLPETEI